MEEKVENWRQEILQSGYFQEVLIKESPMETKYSSNDYIKLLQTFSNHRLLPQETQAKLYEGVSKEIDDTGGYYTRKQNCVAFMAKKTI